MTIQSPLVYELYNLASSERHLHHCVMGPGRVGPGRAGPGREYSDFSLKYERTRSARCARSLVTNLLKNIYTGSEKRGTPVSRYTHTHRSVRAELTSV